jgi:hypothetical protein
VGEDAVLFLYRTPIGYWRTVGGPQGKYTVSAQGRVRTDGQGMAYAEPTSGGTLPFTVGERMPATESANAPSRSRLCLAVWCTPGFLRLAGLLANRLTSMSRTPEFIAQNSTVQK